MNVYFGKIARKNKDQVDGHYYRAPKSWSGYSGLSDGDYVYMLCEGVTHLWKALPYDDENGVRPFEVILPSIGNCTAFLAHIKYLKLSMELAVKSHRQTKGVAFFKLDVDSSFSEENLVDLETYKNADTFRNIVVREDKDSVEPDSYDLQFYFEDGSLKCLPPKFSDESYYKDFRDNLSMIGGNRPKKDKILMTIKDVSNIDKEFDYNSSLDLLKVYDAFMVDYKAREEDVDGETRFWCFNHNYNGCDANGFRDFKEWAYANKSCKMQQEFGVDKQNVKRNWQNACCIKPGDVVFFRAGDFAYAYGFAVEPRKKGRVDNFVEVSAQNIIKEKSSGEYCSQKGYKGYVFFDDAEVFYEDFSDGGWGQRIDVEEWFFPEDDSCVNVQDKSLYKDKHVYLTIKEMKPDDAKKIMESLGYEENMKPDDESLKHQENLLRMKKNIILQGAPGTGKTYATAALALSICDNAVPDGHKEIMARYDELVKQGRIGFVTFHQSMDYEDFVEGFKPQKKGDDVIYDLEDGIFKLICKNAGKIENKQINSGKIDFSKSRIFKMSLGEKGRNDIEVFDFCFEHNVLALGWGDDKDFSSCKERADFKKMDSSWGAMAVEIFKEWMLKDDIVLIADGTKAIKAIAQIVGDYEYHKDYPIEMCQYRKVKWLYSGDSIPISKLYDKNLSQQTIYAFGTRYKDGKVENGNIKLDVLNDIITGDVKNEPVQNYVLIIDEINRGNISKIFGELISLLEADKRVGGEHPLTVTLPYSKEPFSVPPNLYIIGTMNTTDRSVGSIDYAVRRRFAFVTLEADESLVPEGDARNLFNAVKNFLNESKYDMDIEDLMVGHSYFMDSDNLQMKWQYEILPLLMEYHKDGVISKSPLKDRSGNEIENVKKNYITFTLVWQKKESEETKV